MSRFTFSILHASLGRPEKAIEAMWRWHKNAVAPLEVEYFLGINSDDPHRDAYLKLLVTRSIPNLRLIISDWKGSAPAWDHLAKCSTGDILIQAQDDVEPPLKWDYELRYAIGLAGRADDWQKLPMFLAVSDGFRKDRLCCTAIMNRARFLQQGEFLHAGYLSVFSDDEVTIRAYSDAAAGICQLIETGLIFLHRHHYHDKTVPFDGTYAKENSAEAYARGQALFAQRNEKAIADGFRTWH